MKKSSCNSYAVIGLGFGDEGKGACVNSLCRFLPNSLVIRYSGGQQAGHTVTLKDGTSHVFANFSSGSFQGAITYWSKFCSFDPIGVVNELKVLESKGYRPTLYIDKKSPITTPYDKEHNRSTISTAILDGTCGAGVGTTFEREENHYSLTAGDLLFPSVLQIKLKLIQSIYSSSANVSNFLEACEIIRNAFDIHFKDGIPDGFANYIFEGSQGLLLDQNIGFFPHVTRSNTGTQNIFKMNLVNWASFQPHLYLVTRAFQTRHGNGPMTNTHVPHNIKTNSLETNVTNKYQGTFRRALLDLDLLKYGIEHDVYIRETKHKELIITCMDLIENEYRYTINGKIINHLNKIDFAAGVAEYLRIPKVSITESALGITKFVRIDSNDYKE